MSDKSTLLLHVCCAPCSPYVVNLLQKNFRVTAYFYDPNIHPEEEYLNRLEEMKRYKYTIGLPLIEEEYNAGSWFDATKGHESDKEKGERCNLCFKLRMEKTAQFAKANGFDFFSTVLSVSPHKDANMINNIGQILSKKYSVDFLEADFKKRDGFKKSVIMSKEYGFKRQNYCGCIYSRRNTSKT